MNTKLQNQQAVLFPANADRRVSTAHKTMPLAKAVWARVFILFLLLGFWRTGQAQSWFEPGNLSVMGQSPVGIGVVSPATPTAELHVNGQVRFENLNTSTGIQQYLTWQPSGDLAWQTGIAPLPGGNLGETLFWNGIEWQNTDFLTTTSGVGIGIDLPPGGSPLSKLHLGDNSGLGNFALWTNPATTMGARIGHSGTTFQIRQEENDNIEFWVNGGTQAKVFINEQTGGTPFLGVGTPVSLGITGVQTNLLNTPLGTSVVFSADGTGEFNGDLHIAGAYFEASDETLKESFQSMNSGWRKILDIPAYSYTFKQDDKFNFSKVKSYGFKAQEVKQHIPELVAHNGKFHLVNYSGFIPFLTQGLQEHDTEITELKTENQMLNNKVETLESEKEQLERRLKALEDFIFGQQGNTTPSTENAFEQTGTLNQPASLEQNEPNPFTQETVIRFFVPEGAKNARIEVKNMEGKVVGSFTVQSRGQGSLTLKAGSLTAGTYYYSLIVEGKTVDTKSIILL